jgi:hypothetical protein
MYSIPVRATDVANNIAEMSTSVELNNMDVIGRLSVIPDRVKNRGEVEFVYTSHLRGIDVIIPADEMQKIGIAGTLTLTDEDYNGVYVAKTRVIVDTTGTFTIEAEVRDTTGSLFSQPQVVLYIQVEPPELTPPDVLYATIEPRPVFKLGRWEIYRDHIHLMGTVSRTAVRVWWESGERRGRVIGPIPNGIFFFDDIYLKPGTNTIYVYAMDDVGNVGTSTLSLYYNVPKVTEEVGVNGGIVKCPDGSKVEIPAGALLDVADISINALAPDVEQATKQPVSANIMLMGIPHEFGPVDRVFHKPVVITIAYTDLDIERFSERAGMNIDEEALVLFFWSDESCDWIKAGGIVNTASKTVSVRVNHFTIFDIGVDISDIQRIQTKNNKLYVYLDVNPFKHGQESNFVAKLPDDTIRLSIRIFDLAGDLVRVVVEDSDCTDKVGKGYVNIGAWDGKNDYGEYVGTGVYIYQVEIELRNGTKQRICKPIGVVK